MNHLHTKAELIERYAWRLIKWIAIAFCVWVGWLILTPYPHYVRGDLLFGFLRGREQYFYNSGYFLGFYAHIFSAPLALLIGGLQCSRTIRTKWPLVHRWCGRLYVGCVLLFAAPGGFVMAFGSRGGWSATVCFALLATITWYVTWRGFVAATKNDFRAHARWIVRSYLLIMSAVCLRVFHYWLAPLGWSAPLTYQIAAWSSWVLPLVVLEMVFKVRETRPKAFG